jgi:hypothetical protein
MITVSTSWSRAAAMLLLVLALVIAALLVAAWTILPLDDVGLTLNGETFSLADLHGTSAVLFFVATVAVVIFAFVAVMVAIVVGLGFGAIGLAIGLVAAIASLALVAAPFVLIAWLVWRALRSRPAPAITGR